MAIMEQVLINGGPIKGIPGLNIAVHRRQRAINGTGSLITGLVESVGGPMITVAGCIECFVQTGKPNQAITLIFSVSGMTDPKTRDLF